AAAFFGLLTPRGFPAFQREAIAGPRGFAAGLVPVFPRLEQPAHGGFKLFLGQAGFLGLALLGEQCRRVALARLLEDGAVLAGVPPQDGKEHFAGPSLLGGLTERRAGQRQEQAVLVAQRDALRDRPVLVLFEHDFAQVAVGLRIVIV